MSRTGRRGKAYGIDLDSCRGVGFYAGQDRRISVCIRSLSMSATLHSLSIDDAVELRERLQQAIDHARSMNGDEA